MDNILSCGHMATKQEAGSCGTGYADTRDGRRICYSCADSEQSAELRTATRVTLYVNGEGTAIITWSGGVLMQVVSMWKRGHNWCNTALYHVVAKDANGVRWYGDGLGKGMYITLRKAVTK